MREALVEIIQKECEQYKLVELGLLTSVNDVISQLLPFFPVTDETTLSDLEHFAIWRRKVLDCFYSRLNYVEFLRQNKEKPVFRQFLFSLRKRIIARLYKRNTKPTIDSVLAIPPRTLAFKMSVMLSDEANTNLFASLDGINTPWDVEERCFVFCEESYPIGLEALLRYLRKEDGEFWDELYLLIKNLACRVTKFLKVSKLYREEVEQDTWSESSLLLHKKTISGTIPAFENASHFRNYIIQICQRKCKEAMRKNMNPEFSLDDPGLTLDALLMKIAGEQDDINEDRKTLLSDMDNEDEYDVRFVLADILLNKVEPWYSQLTRQQEDKMAVLLQQCIIEQSYSEIASLRAPNASTAEKTRLQAKLRQDVSRICKILRDGFQQILLKQ